MAIVINGQTGIDAGHLPISNAGNTEVEGTLTAQGQNVSPFSGFKNYIINGGFDVWQRGENFIGHSKFYADRWKEDTNTDDGYWVDKIKLNNADLLVTGQSNALKVTTTTGTTGTLNDLRTNIENPSRLVGKIVTLSYWVKSDQSGVVINNIRTSTTINGIETGNDSIGTITIGPSWQKIIKTFVVGSTVDISNSTASDRLDVVLSSPVHQNATMYITGVQLEEGSVATPFENRPYGLELSLCQRYYEHNLFKHYIPNSGASSTITSIPYKVTKRVAASLTYSSVGIFGGYNPPEDNDSVNNENGFNVARGTDELNFHWYASAEL